MEFEKLNQNKSELNTTFTNQSAEPGPSEHSFRDAIFAGLTGLTVLAGMVAVELQNQNFPAPADNPPVALKPDENKSSVLALPARDYRYRQGGFKWGTGW